MVIIKCKKCGKEVEAKSRRQKYCPECREENDRACHKKYYDNNKEKINAKHKEWCDNNKERVRAKAREYYNANKGNISIKHNEWCENNPTYYKDYYENNKEQILTKAKEDYAYADREGNNFCVYIHTDPIGKVYIGRAVGDNVKTVNRQRWQGGSGYKTQKFYDECIAVYGWDNIQHEIIEWGLTYEEVIEREQYWIERYNSRNPEYGYNVA